ILERSQARMLVLEPSFRKIDFPAVLDGVNPAAAKAVERVAVIRAAADALPETVLGKPVCRFGLAELPDGKLPDTGHADSLNLLFTTSGTTSGPKLVMHTQRTVTLHSQRVARGYGFDEQGASVLAA